MNQEQAAAIIKSTTGLDPLQNPLAVETAKELIVALTQATAVRWADFKYEEDRPLSEYTDAELMKLWKTGKLEVVPPEEFQRIDPVTHKAMMDALDRTLDRVIPE